MLTLHCSHPWHRYALQLLTPASILAKLSGRDEIAVEDVEEVSTGLFMDARQSALLLK
jgi:RuvB-like protein 1 (pontin 52)